MIKGTLLPVSIAVLLLSILSSVPSSLASDPETSGNPLFPGWYADPEIVFFEDEYWIFPTSSLKFDDQTYFDCFSSTDLVKWNKHEKVLTSESISWAKRAMWAPSVVCKDDKYYFFFAANDVHEGEIGGIGVAVSDKPDGPYKDLIGKPLINDIINGAQPIDQHVFLDDDGSYYMYYGGWKHCNVVKLSNDFTKIIPFNDGEFYKEITPDNYVEGPFMLKKDGKYYFMWSEGGWTTSNYNVAYAISDSPFGPFKRIGKIIEPDPKVGMGAGHHSVIQSPSGKWYAIYHRRPLDEKDGNSRVTCIDEMFFNDDGTIKPIKLTFEGVKADPVK